MNKNSRYIIVGASGYMGKCLYTAAKKVGETVGTCTSGGNDLLALRLDEVEKFDFSQISFRDVVLLSAAISEPDICAREYDRAWAVNVVGTSKFIENVIQRGARVIFFSSDAVYGQREEEFEVATSCNPCGEYAKMKREVEECFTGNESFKAIRLSYVFSKEDKFSCYLKGCIDRNEEADLFHPFFRAIVHRDDVVEGVLKLAVCWDDFADPIINFGGPQVLSRIEFAECIREVSNNALRFKISEPNDIFFNNRPRVIAMKSPVFARLLGRPQRTLLEAARREFSSFFTE